MEQELLSIMYVGRKPRTTDRVNREPNRIWNGPGTVCQVPVIEAKKLLGFKGQFEDVSDLDEDELTGTANEVRARIAEELREAHRPAEGVVSRTITAASTQELLAELATRGIDVSAVDLSGEDVSGGQKLVEVKFQDLPAAPERDKPEDNDELGVILYSGLESMSAVDGAIEKYFTKQGQPKLDAISQVVGFKVTKKDLEVLE